MPRIEVGDKFDQGGFIDGDLVTIGLEVRQCYAKRLVDRHNKKEYLDSSGGSARVRNKRKAARGAFGSDGEIILIDHGAVYSVKDGNKMVEYLHDCEKPDCLKSDVRQ